MHIPIGVLGNPRVIPSGVVAHPVQNHFHALCMGGIDRGFEIVHRTKLRVDFVIILNAIITAQSTFSVQLSDGIHRHKPKHIHAQGFDAWNFGHERFECTAVIELTGVHLVHHIVFDPVY